LSLEIALTEKVHMPKSEITAKRPTKANAKEYLPKPALPNNRDIITINKKEMMLVKISAIVTKLRFLKIVLGIDIF